MSGTAVTRLQEHNGAGFEEVRAILFRYRWQVIICTVLGTAGAALWTRLTIPLYSGSATLRIEDKEANLPEVVRTLSTGSEVSTEMQVLHSRALLEEAVRRLALQVRVTEPDRVARNEIVSTIEVSESAPPRTYVFTRGAGGRFDVTDGTSGLHVAHATPGDSVRFNGLALTLGLQASAYRRIRIEVRSIGAAVASVSDELVIDRPSREANLIVVQYVDVDSQHVRQVPNVVTAEYMRRRQESQRAEARSSAKFLQEQLDRVSAQLSGAEDEFRSYRERAEVVDPREDASSQVARLIQKQAERSAVEAERQALRQSLDELNRAASTAGHPEPAIYEQLLGLPFLLRNQAASQLLGALAGVENERTELLIRRTPEDADVQILSSRISELEEQLRSIATTYEGGLSNQVASLDNELTKFKSQLVQLPRKQVQFARLERKTKSLEDIYTLLQTRLKEAEIAQTAEDRSVEVVDTALSPQRPIRPKPARNLAGGMAAGLLLGISLTFLRAHFDRKIRTRKDILGITGLRVLGLIPRASREGGRKALLTESRSIREGRRLPTRAKPTPSRVYTFFPTTAPESVGEHLAGPHPIDLHLVLAEAGHAVAEAYGALQTNIVFACPETTIGTLVLTSPLPGDGKTSCAVNLSLTLAHRGLRTLLIDADLRRGVLNTVFELERQPGLTDVLEGRVDLAQALRTAEVGDGGRVLHILTSGRLPPNPAGIVGSTGMERLLAGLRHSYDRIIIDSPPVNVVTDAALLGANADGVIVVARSGVTESHALAYAIEQLRHVNAKVLGVVLNDIDFKRDAVYDRAYKYYNYEEYLSASGGRE